MESGEAAATDSPAGDKEGENVAEDTAETKPDEGRVQVADLEHLLISRHNQKAKRGRDQ